MIWNVMAISHGANYGNKYTTKLYQCYLPILKRALSMTRLIFLDKENREKNIYIFYFIIIVIILAPLKQKF